MAEDRSTSDMVKQIRADFDAAVTTWLSYEDPDAKKSEINEIFHAVGLHISEERDAAVVIGARMCSSVLQALAQAMGRDVQEFWQEILLDAAASDDKDDGEI